MADFDMDCMCDCCRNELNLEKLCVRKVKACKIKVKDLEVSDKFCANELSSPSVCTSKLISNTADFNSECVSNLGAANACIQNLNAKNAGISSLVANNLCVPGNLNVGNLLNCGKYRATVGFSALSNYTLGSNVNFNLTLDDPSGSVSFSPTAYTAPVSGYYMLTYKMNVQNLVPTTGPILGSPIANPEVYVNGNLAREHFSAWLTFNNENKSIIDNLISLKTGDVVTFKYKVLALDAVLGLVEVAGTIDILGNGSEFNNSLFKITLLNVDCPNGAPCQPNADCSPCTPMQCVPCMPQPNQQCQPCSDSGCVAGSQHPNMPSGSCL